GLHVGELLLYQLVGCKRPPELLAVEHVLACLVPAEFRRSHRAPGYAVACPVEAAERTAEPARAWQQILFGHLHVVEHDLAGDRGAEAELALDDRGREPLHAAFDD